MGARKATSPEPITIAILAIGGQGGGVITNWLVRLAESQGWQAQSTSVPGVAQRTGATIYYVEMLPATRRRPVLALLPFPGAVDLVVAAEWMEAGRAVQRGFVTPQRTVLIASTHRAYAISEKSAPGRDFADDDAVAGAVNAASRKLLSADFARAADAAGSVISASLFGAISACGVLPFPREAFEAVIRDGGAGAAASLKAFANGVVAAGGQTAKAAGGRASTKLSGGTKAQRDAFDELCRSVMTDFPAPCREIINAGLVRLVDFQDVAYGQEYLARLARVASLADGHAGLIGELARYLANAMAYQDVIRVADLKTRAARFERVRREAGARDGQIVSVREYLHPRIEEMRSLFPARFQRLAHSKAMRAVLGWFAGAKRVRTDRMSGFVLLYGLAGLRRWRRGTIRHRAEMDHIDGWLDRVAAAARDNRDLAVEIVRCRGLIKGYGDTHARGVGKYDRVLDGIDRIKERDDAADWARRLREAARKDAEGSTLDGALKTIADLAAS